MKRPMLDPLARRGYWTLVPCGDRPCCALGCGTGAANCRMLALMRHLSPGLLSIAALAIVACSADKPAAYQGYVEGEYVHVASAVGGRLEKLLVQRGQTIEAKAPLFRLEADAETAARQQADEQLKAAQAQLADLKLGRRNPELDVARAQLAQAVAAEEQAAQQVKRDEAQFEIGGIARAQLDDSRANLAIKSARVRVLSGQLQVSRLRSEGRRVG